MRVLLMAIALAQSAVVFADEGQVVVGGSVGAELAWLKHPLLSGSLADFDALAPTVAMPRARIEAHYCLTNDLEIGVGVDGTAGMNVTTRGNFRGVAAAIVTGGFFAVGIPLSLAWRFDVGLPVSVVAGFDVAPAVALWSGNALVNESILDSKHRPQRLPVDVSDAWVPELDGTVRLRAEWRLDDSLSVNAGTYLAAGWNGGDAVHVGVTIGGAWIIPPLSP